MSSAQDKLNESCELVSSAVRAIANLEQVHLVQLLGNADEVILACNSSDDKADIPTLIKHMIKSPIRCEIGRFRGMLRSLQVALACIKDAQSKIHQASTPQQQ